MAEKRPLVNQPTAAPSRKLVYLVIAGMVTAAVRVVLETFVPGAPFTEDILPYINEWVIIGIMAFVGYMTKNRAPKQEVK